jgi:GH24 family phage-related lysozyme (muramidase)
MIFRGMRRAIKDFNQSFSDWELRGLLLFGIIIVAIGVAFYTQVEGWDFFQALYFCIATLTTVGYGDLVPTSDLSRLFTTFYILIGVGFVLSFITMAARKATKPLADRIAARHHDNPPQQK